MIDVTHDFRQELSPFQVRLLMRAIDTPCSVSITGFLSDAKMHGEVLVAVTYC